MTARGRVPPPGADATADLDEGLAGGAASQETRQLPGTQLPGPMQPPPPFLAPAPMLPPEPMRPPAPFLAPEPMLPPGPVRLEDAALPGTPPAADPAPAASPAPAAGPPGTVRAPAAQAGPAPAVSSQSRGRNQARPPARAPAPQEHRDRALPPGRPRRRTKRLALLAGAGIVVLAASLRLAAGGSGPIPAAPQGADVHSAIGQSASAQASTSAPGTGAPGSSAPGGTSAPHGRAARWLGGLSSLEQKMIGSQGQGIQTVTPRFLRRSAMAMRRCARDLAALGPPPRLLRHRYQLARQACAALARAAKLNVAAAHVMSTAGGNDPRLTNLLNQANTDVNQGFNLLSSATYQVPSLP